MIKDKKMFILLFLMGIIIVTAVIGPYFLPHDPNYSDISNGLKAPGVRFWFGTDLHGRDIFSRTIAAGRISITASLLIVAVSGIFGTFVGMISGYAGGKCDQILMGICDMFLSFPQMVIAIGVAGILGGGLINAMIALAISNWMLYARLARSAILKEKEELYVTAAKFSGLSDFEIICKHIFVNIKSVIFVTMTLNFSTTLISLSGLSFIGIGVQVPKAEWGSMINEGRLYLSTAPWICLFPALAVVFVVFVFNLSGDYLQKKYNYKEWKV